ncbi:MAG: class I SAM-dependent methyltransferase [Myxococcales bacterium]|nr:class I SAM-dependent methyltransferase [Myxococcales bacterium]MCB9669084.1 class I SAM-dependent methyltransferase [Alphaproteobacteria bacterium]
MSHVRLNTELTFVYAVHAAVSTGLLEGLARGAVPQELDPGVVDRVLDVLASRGWVRHDEGGWVVAPWLVGAGPFDIGRMAGILGHTDRALRDGGTVMRGEVRHTADVVRGLARMLARPAEHLARELGPCGGTVVDVGCGAASWSLAMLGNDPEARVVGLDRDTVLVGARAEAVERGLAARFTGLPGSFWETPFPRARRVVLANVVHLLGPTAGAALVARCAAALEPGGELVVVDVLEGRPHDADVAAYALQLRLREPTGTVHTAETVGHWCADAGLGVTRVIPLRADIAGLAALVAQSSTTNPSRT